MARKTEIVCDRCGEEMVYSGWTAKLKGIKKAEGKFKKLKLYCGNPSGYDYLESEVELCKECTKKLEEFLSAPHKKPGAQEICQSVVNASRIVQCAGDVKIK